MTTDELYSILMKAKYNSKVVFQYAKDCSMLYWYRYEYLANGFVIYVGDEDKGYKVKRLRNQLTISWKEVCIVRANAPDNYGFIDEVIYYDCDGEVFVYFDD